MVTDEDIPTALGVFIAALDDARTPWSLLRPRELLADARGDVDVLVEPAQLAPAARLLAAAGFLAMGGDAANAHGLIRDDRSGRFVWVHLQCALSMADVVVPAAELLAHRDGARPPQPEGAWLFWILILRVLLVKTEIPQRHREPLQRLATADVPPPLRAVATRHDLDPVQVAELCAAADWRGVEALRPAPHRVTVTTPSLRVRRLARRMHAAARVLRGPAGALPGLSVAVIGPDGAGKTTLVTSLAATLPFITRIQYLGLTGGRIYRADKLRVPGVVFVARLGVLWSRYLRGHYHRAQGRVVLFERYVLDAVAPSGIALSPVGRLSRRLQRWSVPLPDLVLLLDASGETLHRRSEEYDSMRLERWRGAFAGLQRTVTQLEVLDAERPPEVVLADAQERIWRAYRARRADTGT